MAQAAVSQELKRTPLYDRHAALGAKLVPFAGFEMPVQYPAGITAEHRAVRERCGVFDVSHMGELIVRGPGAVAFANHVTTNDVAALAVGQVQYSTLCNDRGTIEDDCLVYRFADRVMIVVNASNVEKDWAHVTPHLARFDCAMENVSDDIGLLALQGPAAAEILAPLTDVDLAAIQYYHFAEGAVAGARDVVVSRTGYTGEDGFELYCRAGDAVRIWDALLATGQVAPAGLGARDSLRLEMGMALYGNEIDDTTTPLEANLGWLVKLDKGEFAGRDALRRQKQEGLKRRLVGFTTAERAFPRHGYAVYYEGQPSGIICSGTVSPSLEIPIGTCYLPIAAAKAGEGTPLEVEIRGKRVAATVMRLPFYKHGSHL
jgi:aminomethyltransferase